MGVFFIRSVLKIITIILVLRKNRSQRNYCFHHSLCHPPFCFVADWQRRRLETNGGNNRINFSKWVLQKLITQNLASGFTHYTGSKYSLEALFSPEKRIGSNSDGDTNQSWFSARNRLASAFLYLERRDRANLRATRSYVEGQLTSLAGLRAVFPQVDLISRATKSRGRAKPRIIGKGFQKVYLARCKRQVLVTVKPTGQGRIIAKDLLKSRRVRARVVLIYCKIFKVSLICFCLLLV